MFSSHNTFRGFSLIELGVVVALIGIVVAVVLPSLLSSRFGPEKVRAVSAALDSLTAAADFILTPSSVDTDDPVGVEVARRAIAQVFEDISVIHTPDPDIICFETPLPGPRPTPRWAERHHPELLAWLEASAASLVSVNGDYLWGAGPAETWCGSHTTRESLGEAVRRGDMSAARP